MPQQQIAVFMLLAVIAVCSLILFKNSIDSFVARFWADWDEANFVPPHKVIRPILPFSGQKITRQ